MIEKCPDCGAQNPTTEHLLAEYKSLMKAGFNNMFGHNARQACNQVIEMLEQRGITSYETIFGTTYIRRWDLSKW